MNSPGDRWIYLRAEAVNFGAFVSDTTDLSTIRGSGLAILDLSSAVEKAITAWSTETENEPQAATLVTSGASQAIFRVTYPVSGGGSADFDKDWAEDLRNSVDGYLRREGVLKYATIVVDAKMVADVGTTPETSTKYPAIREGLISRNRLRQMRSLGFSPTGIVAGQSSPKFDEPNCSVDMVRVAEVKPTNVRKERLYRNDKEKSLGFCRSVSERRQFGFDMRQTIYADEMRRYAEETGLKQHLWQPAFETEAAWDFHQIADPDEAADEESSPFDADNLFGKIAVLYVDGNSFGDEQREFATTEARQAQWDRAVKGRQRAALRAMLDRSVDDEGLPVPGWWNRKFDKQKGQEVWRLRLETLLWGGDETMFVVPAWNGIEAARLFFDAVDDYANQAAERGEDPKLRDLTFSAGLVFCHVAAPISRIKDLADELAGEAKDAFRRERHAISYAVLESFDRIGDDLKSDRARHLPLPSGALRESYEKAYEGFSVAADELAELTGDIAEMRDRLPRGSLYRLLRSLADEPLASTESESVVRSVESQFDRWFSRASRDFVIDKKNSDWIKRFVDREPGSAGMTIGQRMRWLHLAELWDYVPEAKS